MHLHETSQLAAQLRVDSVRAAATAGSGHTTSSLSAADLMAVLLAAHLKYDFANPAHPLNDHLIFSKGHASPLLYAMYKAAGVLSDSELRSYRGLDSRLQGHPTPALPWVDVATGSLGQGLPVGVGIALAGKHIEHMPYRTWVLCGDSEMAEGSIWEAFDKASFYELGNLIAILDMNRLGQRGPTAHEWNTERYAARAEAFGWQAISIDGHNLAAIDHALNEAVLDIQRPTLIIARTIKGKGVSFLEDQAGWHGKPTDTEQTRRAIDELGGERSITVPVHVPDLPAIPQPSPPAPTNMPTYSRGEQAATRDAYGEGLRAVAAADSRIIGLDAEVSDSTRARTFAEAFPERFFEMFIAEQQMVAAATGLAVRGYRPFASTFAAFLTRAHDFLRMAAISQVDLRLCGSHAGVSIGQDGPSQMGLEDLAMMRALYGSTVLYPCDAPQTVRLVAAMAEQPGISYLRTTRSATPVIYEADEPFLIGGSKVLRQTNDDSVAIVAAGVTVHEALAAHAQLQAEGLPVRVIDAYSVKPIDIPTITAAVRDVEGRLIVVEDHRPEGGLGSAVLEALADGHGYDPKRLYMTHLAVRNLPGSATPAEQLDAAGISARHIVAAARTLVGREIPTLVA
jgi:transketolase